ncbi:MAG: SUF system NifU family Fe-S cluster assembly protein [Kineosporiaceae bacterium]
MNALDQLYQQVILDHYKEKHGYGLRDALRPAVIGQSEQYNPLCGDEVTLRVALAGVETGTPQVEDVSWVGNGCSISQASTSVLHDLVVGASLTEAEKVVEAFREMVRSRGQVEPDEDVLGDGIAFHGVGRHANRVKCAMLGWTAFEAAVMSARAASTEENP